jgi:hypothetical protein
MLCLVRCSVAAAGLLVALAGGCGSATPGELPPAARPAVSPPLRQPPAGSVVALDGRRARALAARRGVAGHTATTAGGRLVARVAPRARVLELLDRRTGRRVDRAPAGVGPTHVVADRAGHLFVVDTEGDGLLLFRVRPRLELVRRVALATAPYGIAIDRRRRRLWVTLTGTNRLVEVTANGRPRPLRSLPAVRAPHTVAVQPRTGRVLVIGRSPPVLQRVDP